MRVLGCRLEFPRELPSMCFKSATKSAYAARRRSTSEPPSVTYWRLRLQASLSRCFVHFGMVPWGDDPSHCKSTFTVAPSTKVWLWVGPLPLQGRVHHGMVLGCWPLPCEDVSIVPFTWKWFWGAGHSPCIKRETHQLLHHREAQQITTVTQHATLPMR